VVFERLKAELRLDAGQFKSELQSSADDMSSFGDRASSLGSSLQRTGAGMAAGISLPIAGIGAASLKTASEVEEMESKFSEVFQSSADDVADWADTHADEIGRSQNQLQEYAAGFGSLLDAMGASTDETADMSKELTSLTADLASFENMSEQQVQSKLESALSGQGRAVRDFGVSLSAAREEQILMNEGIAESREEATEAELAQARLIAIQKDTATAQGDAARTSESFANQTRALKADIEDMRAEIGQHLLPVASSLLGHVRGLTGAFGNLSGTQQQVVIAFAALAASLGPIALGLGTILTMIPAMQAGWAALAAFQWATAIPAAAATVAAYAPIIATVGAIGVAVAALWMIWDSNLGNIQGRTQEAVSSIIGFLEPFITLLREDFIETFNTWREAGEDVLSWFEGRWSEHGDTIIATVEPFLKLLETSFDMTFQTIELIVKTAIDALATVIRTGLAVMRGDFEGAFDLITDFLDRQIDRFKGFGKSMMETLASGIKDAASAPVDAVEDSLDGVRDRMPFSDAQEGPLQDLTDSGEAIPGTLAKGADSNMGALESSMNGLPEPPTPTKQARAGSSSGNGGQGQVVNELRAMRNALEGMHVRVETGDETLDRVIKDKAWVVVEEHERKLYQKYRSRGIRG